MPKAKYREFDSDGNILLEASIDYWLVSNESPESICVSLPDGKNVLREVIIPKKDILKLINKKAKS